MTLFFVGIIFVLLVIFVGYYFVNNKEGRKKAIEVVTGLKVIGEPVNLSHSVFKPKLGFAVNQEVNIVKCTDGQKDYYVLENIQKFLGGIQNTFIKLTKEDLAKLRSFKD